MNCELAWLARPVQLSLSWPFIFFSSIGATVGIGVGVDDRLDAGYVLPFWQASHEIIFSMFKCLSISHIAFIFHENIPIKICRVEACAHSQLLGLSFPAKM